MVKNNISVVILRSFFCLTLGFAQLILPAASFKPLDSTLQKTFSLARLKQPIRPLTRLWKKYPVSTSTGISLLTLGACALMYYKRDSLRGLLRAWLPTGHQNNQQHNVLENNNQKKEEIGIKKEILIKDSSEKKEVILEEVQSNAAQALAEFLKSIGKVLITESLIDTIKKNYPDLCTIIFTFDSQCVELFNKRSDKVFEVGIESSFDDILCSLQNEDNFIRGDAMVLKNALTALGKALISLNLLQAPQEPKIIQDRLPSEENKKQQQEKILENNKIKPDGSSLMQVNAGTDLLWASSREGSNNEAFDRKLHQIEQQLTTEQVREIFETPLAIHGLGTLLQEMVESDDVPEEKILAYIQKYNPDITVRNPYNQLDLLEYVAMRKNSGKRKKYSDDFVKTISTILKEQQDWLLKPENAFKRIKNLENWQRFNWNDLTLNDALSKDESNFDAMVLPIVELYIQRGEKAAIKKLVEEPLGSNNETILHALARYGKEELIEKLQAIVNDLNWDTEDSKKNTPKKLLEAYRNEVEKEAQKMHEQYLRNKVKSALGKIKQAVDWDAMLLVTPRRFMSTIWPIIEPFTKIEENDLLGKELLAELVTSPIFEKENLLNKLTMLGMEEQITQLQKEAGTALDTQQTKNDMDWYHEKRKSVLKEDIEKIQQKIQKIKVLYTPTSKNLIMKFLLIL